MRKSRSYYGRDSYDRVDVRTPPMSRERSFTADRGSRQTMSRDNRSMEFDQRRPSPRDQQKPAVRSSVNYQGKLLQLFLSTARWKR